MFCHPHRCLVGSLISVGALGLLAAGCGDDSGPGNQNGNQLQALCGDGEVEASEECDDGNSVAGDGCSPTCQKECGDGVVGPAEACDDGNRVSGDGCQADCRLPTCGDGVVDGGLAEACDEGLANADVPERPCRSDCTRRRCGDGIIDLLAGEDCDDGNGTAGDGCSPDCQVEVP